MFFGIRRKSVEKIEEGLFATEEAMPCKPRDIKIGRYSVGPILGHMEKEDVAARVITFSQQLDRWVGVSWPRIVQMLKEELEAFTAHNSAKHHNMKEEDRFNNATSHYRMLCTWTLGLYTLFVKKPEKNLKEVPAFKQPFSGIYLEGPNFVVNGIHELLEVEMLKLVQENDGEKTIDVFFPTPKLIQLIMQKQGLATA
jgi:hypothetical protein